VVGLVIVTAGAVESFTVMVKEPEAMFPLESVAEQRTVVVPNGNVEPEAGLQTGVIEPSTLSVAVAV
jgi:hypothetical protein